MEKENPIYIGMNYSDALESRRGLLSLEISLLELIKSLRRYSLLKQEEFEIKSKVYKTIKETNTKIKKTISSFPSLKTSKKIEKTELKKGTMPKEEIDVNLESQLREIQEKLRTIGQ